MDGANESWVLRFFGVQEAEVCRAASGLAGRYGLTQVESRSQGPETLLALTAPAPALHKAEGRLRRTFRAGLYGTGEQTLADCAARALVKRDRLLACGDKLALELLAPRLEGRDGVDRVFDFGAGSCEDPDASARIEALALRRDKKGTAGPVARELNRLRATLKVTKADLAAGALSMEERTLVAVAGRKGSWFYLAGAGENPALWLLDILRRAAEGRRQSPEVCFVPRGKRPGPLWEAQAAPAESAAPEEEETPESSASAETSLPAPQTHRRRWPARLAFVLGVVALAGLAAALRVTDGDLTALPSLVQSMMEGSQLPAHSGAALI